MACGVPLGSAAYVSAHLSCFGDKFTNTAALLQTRVVSPASKLRLFQACVQQQYPFRQFADVCLPTTRVSFHEDYYSPFATRIRNVAQDFLATLTGQVHLPQHSWLLATLPQTQGGLGLHDPCTMAPLILVRALTRTLRYSVYGIPIRIPFVSGREALPDPSLWSKCRHG